MITSIRRDTPGGTTRGSARAGLVCLGALAAASLAACSSSGGAGTGDHSMNNPGGTPVVTPAGAQATVPQTSSSSTTAQPPVFEIDALAGMKYQLPQSHAPAGTVTVKLVNKATDMPHEADLFLLHHGVTTAQFTKALLSEPLDQVADIAGPIGGPGGVGPGHDAAVTLHLEPNSTYGVICDIPAADGQPHYKHGMISSFTTGDDDGVALPTASSNTIVMADDKYTVPGAIDWSAPVEVINKGTTVHQMQILGPAPGKSLDDVIAALKAPPGSAPAGPPPYLAYGGVAVAVPGVAQTFTPHLQPGKYVLVCMVVDPKMHMPHFAMGMLTKFTVS